MPRFTTIILSLFLLIPSFGKAQQVFSNLDVDYTDRNTLKEDLVKKTFKDSITKDNLKTLGLSNSKADQKTLASFLIRALLHQVNPNILINALANIYKDPHSFLKKVCYVNNQLWCYMALVNPHNSSHRINLHHLVGISFKDTLELSMLLFERYNDNIQDTPIRNQVTHNFESWDPKNGASLLKIFEGNYIGDIQTAEVYIEKFF
jgi:hypothetical protein